MSVFVTKRTTSPIVVGSVEKHSNKAVPNQPEVPDSRLRASAAQPLSDDLHVPAPECAGGRRHRCRRHVCLGDGRCANARGDPSPEFWELDLDLGGPDLASEVGVQLP